MHNALSTIQERLFTEQSEIFISQLLHAYGVKTLEDLPAITERPALPLEPTLINDFRHLTADECESISQQFHSEYGVAYFIVLNHNTAPLKSHPLFDISSELRDVLHLHYPVEHPLETHHEAIKKFGEPDGTVKIYDLDGAGGALTSKSYSAHQDGLGNCGDIETAALYTDSVPIFGGFNYFINICRIALDLAKIDREAFHSLFLPNAITIVRSTGKLRIKVTTPVLFLGPDGRPQASFRQTDSEYQVLWRSDRPDLSRAKDFLLEYVKPFAYGSCFLHLAAPGHGCFNQNQLTVHGRTKFLEGTEAIQRRLLSRKWFAISSEFSEFKLAPGIRILQNYARLFPDLFGPQQLEGGWLYDQDSDSNMRVVKY